jgi:hypothetical protein
MACRTVGKPRHGDPAGRLGGDAELRTVRGSIQVTEAAQGALTLRTEAGAITVGDITASSR